MIEYKKRQDSFIASLCDDEVDELKEIEKYALENDVPIIKKGARELLRTILHIKNPSNVLEIGTAIGFSAILISKELPKCKIRTIENYKKRIAIAHDNFKKYGYEGKIEILEGDALDILARDTESYDLIFLDAAKAQYITLLPDLIRLLNEGGVLIADNVLHDSYIFESRFAVERRDRTIHTRLREYLYEVTHNNMLKSSIVPIDDGICISNRVGGKFI